MRLLPALLLAAACRAPTEKVDTGTLSAEPLDADGDGYLAEEDCDDGDDAINPGAVEICDSTDNNCDGQIDEGVTTPFYADADGDGFGDPAAVVEACEAPSGTVSVPNDCNDADGDSFPGAAERCDGADNDCDGEVDEDIQLEWHADADADGYGDPDAVIEDCDPPDGYVSDDSDCDDLNADARPDGEEVCDEADNDCDGEVDEGVTATYYQDTDGDGYGLSGKTTESCDRPTGYAAEAGDCDDSDRTVSPSAAELCDGADNDCDGDTDEDDASDAATWYADDDGDGYGDASDAAVACLQPTGRVSDRTDCDDSEPAANPGEAEVCDDIDNDCDGETDEDSATDASVWYADSDGDGYGGSSSTVACAQPSGFADNSDDCDDGEPSANPGEAEVCDEVDNDCDGDTDEGVTSTYYLDADGDGYGDDDATAEGCSAPTAAYTEDGGDCDDTDGSVNPGASEACDGTDADCDGAVDNDADGDGYSADSCGGDDCNDDESSIYPDSDGVCAEGEDCADILALDASAADGTYTIDPDGADSGEDPFAVTCDMTTDGGGWTLVADYDFSSDSCIGGWSAVSAYGACYRAVSAAGAVSATVDTLGLTYGEVLGEAAGYQFYSMDAFHGSGDVTSTTDIESTYVDGMSITHGAAGSRSHIFSYGVGLTSGGYSAYDCPGDGGISPPSFVGSDYLCDTGNTATSSYSSTVYGTLLFSGDDWISTLSADTSDDIEVRLMSDQESSNEEFYLTTLELWVR